MTKEYTTFTCGECGQEARNSYSEPYFTDMLKHKRCFICQFWQYQERKLEKEHRFSVIIDGAIYGLGSRTSGPFRGMAGRRFDIEFIPPSAFAGKRVSCFDVWAGGKLPKRMHQRFPDTAKFLNEAERVELAPGGIFEVCWNPSTSREMPYPNPSTLEGLK